MAKVFIREVAPYANLYKDDRNGLAWIEDGSTGMGHSVHANIDATGSVRGMKERGYWNKKDRTIRSHGFIYNIDTFVCSSDLDRICAAECSCVACCERKAQKGF